MNLNVYSLADNPSFKTGQLMKSVWPIFMSQDKYSMKYWGEMRKLFPDYQLCLCDGEELVGVGNSLPISWNGTIEELPNSWTETLVQGVERNNLNSVNTLAAVNIAIHPNYQKSGLSQKLLLELKDLAGRKELKRFIVPVRPSLKVDYPLTPFDNYIHWKRQDGKPFDPWIRTHWKIGARILKPIYNAMTVRGTIVEWEEWTNMSFPEDGMYIVKGALQPIHINREHDLGIYHDPNVWMEYKLSND